MCASDAFLMFGSSLTQNSPQDVEEGPFGASNVPDSAGYQKIGAAS